MSVSRHSWVVDRSLGVLVAPVNITVFAVIGFRRNGKFLGNYVGREREQVGLSSGISRAGSGIESAAKPHG